MNEPKPSDPIKTIDEPIIVIGDIHGCWKSLKALLSKLPHNRICLVGDLIDRGKDSRSVMKWAIGNNVDCVMGNHDHMMLCAHVAYLQQQAKQSIAGETEAEGPESSMFEPGEENAFVNLWMRNGGRETLLSYDPHEEKTWHECVPKKHLAWIGNLPEFIIYQMKGQPDLIVSHTGHAYGADCMDTALWARGTRFPKDGKYRVFGHSIVRAPSITDTYAAIDTGSFLSHGSITAFEWPTKQVWQQKNIE